MNALLLILLLVQQQAVPSAPGTVTGTILYSDGTPTSGMMVRLTPIGQTASPGAPNYTFTNAAGAYSIRAPSGRYLVQLNATNPIYYPGVVNPSDATPVVVTPGATSSGVNFSLPLSASGVRVQGRITLPSNYPVPTTALEIWLTGTPRKIAADGTFEFIHVPPGVYQLAVSAPGSQPVPITVSDRDITELQVAVPPMVPVQGSVNLEGTGARPRLNLLIEALLSPGMTRPATPNGPFRTTVTPRSDGSFSTPLPPGDYRISMTNLASGYYLKGIASGEAEIMGAPLKVRATDISIKLAVTVGMSSGVHVAGRVTQSNVSSPSMPERIMLTGLATPENADVLIHSDGSFDIPKILPGSYLARVTLGRNISSPPTSIVIPNRNVGDLEVPVPAPRKVSGKVAVDGNGPPPKFTLLLARGTNSILEAERPGEAPTLSVAALINSVLAGGKAGSQVLELDIDALPDGSFTVEIPDGEYQVVVLPSTPQMNLSGVPPAYFLRSLTSSSADLLKEPLVVSEKETPEIHIGLGTTTANPWVKVSGRVKGLDAARGTMRVALESAVTSRIETFVDPEGRFEFPVVLQRTRYTAKLLPEDDAASTPRINVEDKDVADVEIVAPPKREVTARVVVEGDFPVPSVGLVLTAKDSSMTVVIHPEADGSARIKLPEDERRISQFSGLPFGYDLKSITYGSTDLRRQPLRLAESAAAELKITLTVDSSIPSGSLRGKVTGVDLSKGSVRIVLNGVTAYARFESTLSDDGSFNFARLPQGTYIGTLEGDSVSGSLTPNSIVVSGTELAGIELASTLSRDSNTNQASDQPQGATVSDFGITGRATANESAAVANLRTINTAQVTYLSASGGKYGSLQDLIAAGLLDDSFANTKSGFNFSIIAIGTDYAAAAVPSNSATGRYGFYSVPDAVVRYSTFEPLAPSHQSGRAVQ